MNLNEEEVNELQKLLKFSIHSGYKTNTVTKELAHKLLSDKEIESAEIDNIGISLIN